MRGVCALTPRPHSSIRTKPIFFMTFFMTSKLTLPCRILLGLVVLLTPAISLLAQNKNNSSHPDTAFTIDTSNFLLEYLIGDEMKNGNAGVFYKKWHTFVDTVMEIFGIINRRSNAINPHGHYQSYLREGEKLASLRKE